MYEAAWWIYDIGHVFGEREVRAVQRDAWKAATKAQLENDNQNVMEAGITLYDLVPFPEREGK